MKNFAQLSFEFSQRETVKKIVVGKTALKAFEVNYSIPTPKGMRDGQRFVRANSPKVALAKFKKQMTKDGVQFYEAFEVVSPNKVKGNVVYKVYENLHIIR